MAQGVNVKVEMVASPTSIGPAIVDYAEKNKVDLDSNWHKRTAPVRLGQTSTLERCIRRSDLC